MKTKMNKKNLGIFQRNGENLVNVKSLRISVNLNFDETTSQNFKFWNFHIIIFRKIENFKVLREI